MLALVSLLSRTDTQIHTHSNTHLIIDALSGKLLVCPFCDWGSSKKSALSNHVLTHAEACNPYKDVAKKVIDRRKRPTNATKIAILEQLRVYYEKYGEHFPRTYSIEHIGFAKQDISDWVHSPRLTLVAYLPECASKKRLRNVVLADKADFREEMDVVFERFLYRRRVKGLETS